jgi:RNA polymerase sigma factor (TIGR02999 family)
LKSVPRTVASLPDPAAVSDATQILNRIEHDDTEVAHELLPLVYAELRRLAAYKMAREAPGQTLQPTALVHEAWLRLAGENHRRFRNRTHFFHAAGEAMRCILIDRARQRQCARHGGGLERLDAAELALLAPENDERLLAVNDALEQLATEDPLKADVVKLRFFVGLSDREVAQALSLSERTIERYWAYSKAWLIRHLDETQ